MNAVSGIAEWPAVVKNLFVTDTKNNAGIIGVKLYIRGKPWVVSLDERMWFATTRSPHWLLFARESTDDKAIWGAVLEKAWAKVRGNYMQTNLGDAVKNGLSIVTGVPVFS